MKKGKGVLYFTILLFIVLSALLVVCKRYLDNKELNRGIVQGIAIVVDIRHPANGCPNVYYEFQIAGTLHKGSDGINSYDNISIGDSCSIVYAKNNYEISRLVKDKNDRVVIVNKSTNDEIIKEMLEKYLSPN